MKNKKNVLIFTGMISEKFGAIERYYVEIARQLAETSLHPIFIYNILPSNQDYLQLLYNYYTIILQLFYN